MLTILRRCAECILRSSWIKVKRRCQISYFKSVTNCVCSITVMRCSGSVIKSVLLKSCGMFLWPKYPQLFTIKRNSSQICGDKPYSVCLVYFIWQVMHHIFFWTFGLAESQYWEPYDMPGFHIVRAPLYCQSSIVLSELHCIVRAPLYYVRLEGWKQKGSKCF